MSATEDEVENGREKEEQKNTNIVDWDGPHDPKNPMNFSMMRKGLMTAALGGLNFCVTFSSSVLTTGTEPIAKEYGVSTVVSTLATSLFVMVGIVRTPQRQKVRC